MRLNFHGELAKLYGPTVSIEARSVKDALDGFSRQQENWPRGMRVVAVGFDTPDKLEQAPGEVDVMPSFIGGGGKFQSILLGAVEIGISFLPFVGQAAAVALRIGGALMMATGVINLFIKAPTMKSANDVAASKYLAVNKNTTDVGTPIAMLYGTIDVAGQWLSLNSDSNNLTHGVFPATPT